MKKNLKILRIKERVTPLFWVLTISLSLLYSCKTKEETKFRWEAGISAPKYYPVAGSVDFGNAGNGSNTSFAPGWGETYGAVVGEKWKDVPTKVYVDYYSVVDGKGFKGDTQLPQQKIRDLFKKYNLDNENNTGELVVGMAPGGWIRVWFQAFDEKQDDLVNIEIINAQLKSYEDETVGIGLKTKDLKTWGSTYTYWQHHGVPYEAWAENEKEYDIIFDFNRHNNREIQFSYISQDGTYYQGNQGDGTKIHQKIPVQIEQMPWSSKSGDSYCCKVPMPKGFKKYIEQKKIKEIRFQLEIEDNDQYAVLYLVANNKKEKVLRFRNHIPSEKERKEIDYDYAKEVEYFIR